MNNYIFTVENWLSNSTKNSNFFRTNASYTSRKEYKKEWSEAYKALDAALDLAITKEDYLTWRRVWRSLYQKLSDESRMSKRYRKPPVESNIQNSVPVAISDTASILNIDNVEFLRNLATNLLIMRQDSKELAEMRYQRTHEVKMEIA